MPYSTPEARKAYAAAYYKRNQEKMKSNASKFYSENKEQRIQQACEWRRQNPEKTQQYRAKERQRPEIKAAVAEATRRRRHQKNLIHLTEGEKMFLNSYYLQAAELTEQTGVPHEVDHVIPLVKGGLHAPWNLQVLTRFENRSKGGRLVST